MRRDLFKRIKDGRLDRIRKHLDDESLTTKQRQELRKEVRRRESLLRQHSRNQNLMPRINHAIRASTTPLSVRQTASRYKNVMTPNQRANILNVLRRVRKNAEDKHMNMFLMTRNYEALLRELRKIKTHAASVRDALSRSKIRYL